MFSLDKCAMSNAGSDDQQCLVIPEIDIISP